MNQKYEKLMVQHGGYIPFSVLGGKHHESKKSTKGKKKRRTTNKFKKKRYIFELCSKF